MNWIAKILQLTPQQTNQATPFFLLYLALFASITIADAVSITLFASRIGANQLPVWYGATAILNFCMMSWYLTQVRKAGSDAIFIQILGMLATLLLFGWGTYRMYGGGLPLGILFMTKEVATTLILMHFGTFLQDYFVRTELNRLLPVIYAGGRVGGIVGGGIVSSTASPLGTENLILLSVLLIVSSGLAIRTIVLLIPTCDDPEGPSLPTTKNRLKSKTSDSNLQNCSSVAQTDDRNSLKVRVLGFLRQVLKTPLLRWITITTLTFIGCRWFLAYQYTAFFESYFDDERQLMTYLGRYTQIALTLSLILQLVLLNRLIDWLGIKSTHVLYSVLVFTGLLGNMAFPSLAMATASRFFETELRFGLRNPINQMMVNRFPKKMRISVRAWSLGWLIPIGTITSSAAIGWLILSGSSLFLAIASAMSGIAFIFSAIRVGDAYNRFK
jgi:hypothetical protein